MAHVAHRLDRDRRVLRARFVYFYCRLLARHDYVFALSDRARARPALALLGLAVWALVNGALVFTGFSERPVISLALGFAGAGAIIVTGTLLARMQLARASCAIAASIPSSSISPSSCRWRSTRTVLLKTGIDPRHRRVSLIVTVAGVAGALLIWWGAKRAGAQLPVRAARHAFWIAPKKARAALQAAE